jgi:hypothetical protein
MAAGADSATGRDAEPFADVVVHEVDVCCEREGDRVVPEPTRGVHARLGRGTACSLERLRDLIERDRELERLLRDRQEQSERDQTRRFAIPGQAVRETA